MMKKILFVFALFMAMGSAKANNLINHMQGCQAVIEFINEKLESAPESYSKADIAVIKKGLNIYKLHIQNSVITPELAKISRGDKQLAQAMQVEINKRNKNTKSAYAQMYPHNRMLTDYAMTMNNCTKKTVPAGQDLKTLKSSLETIVKLARQPH